MLLRYGRLARRSGQGCFTVKPARAGPWASWRCACCLRRPSGEAWIRLGLLFLPEAGLGRGRIVSLEWTEPWPELRPSGFCNLCWWWLPSEFRSLGNTPNYGPRQIGIILLSNNSLTDRSIICFGGTMKCVESYQATLWLQHSKIAPLIESMIELFMITIHLLFDVSHLIHSRSYIKIKAALLVVLGVPFPNILATSLVLSTTVYFS
jgi:hypothetical protein